LCYHLFSLHFIPNKDTHSLIVLSTLFKSIPKLKYNNPNGVHEARAIEVFPTDGAIVAIPGIMEFMQGIAGNEEIAIR
jgi:hypothetical protein